MFPKRGIMIFISEPRKTRTIPSNLPPHRRSPVIRISHGRLRLEPLLLRVYEKEEQPDDAYLYEQLQTLQLVVVDEDPRRQLHGGGRKRVGVPKGRMARTTPHDDDSLIKRG